MQQTLAKTNLKNRTRDYFKDLYKSVINVFRNLKADMVLAALYITALVSPTISAFTRTTYGYPAVFAVYIAWFVTCLLRARKNGKKFLIDKSRIAEVVMMVVWLVFISLTYLFGRGENGYWALIYTIMFMTVYMIDYMYSIYNERHVLKSLMIVALFVFALHSLISIFMLQDSPLLAREFNAYYYDNIEKYAPLEYQGLGSYSFFTSLAIAVPVFIYMAATMKRKIIVTIMYLLCIAGCFYAAYAGIIIMIMVTLFVMLVYSVIFPSSRKQKATMAAIVTLSIILIVNLFAWMLPHTTNEMYKAKLRDLLLATVEIDIAPQLAQGDGTGEGGGEEEAIYTETSRFEFYMVSLETIIKHPLFGVGPYFKTKTVVNGIGGHSSWLDYLAMYGIVGCSPLIMFFIFYFRRTVRMTKSLSMKVMRIIPWVLFMGYGLLNPVFTAKNFPVVLMLLTAGALPCGQLSKFADVFKKKSLV